MACGKKKKAIGEENYSPDEKIHISFDKEEKTFVILQNHILAVVQGGGNEGLKD